METEAVTTQNAATKTMVTMETDMVEEKENTKANNKKTVVAMRKTALVTAKVVVTHGMNAKRMSMILNCQSIQMTDQTMEAVMADAEAMVATTTTTTKMITSTKKTMMETTKDTTK